MTPTGLEPEACSPQKTPFLKPGGAESGALFGDDERLRLLLEAWAELPESVKDTCADFTGSLTTRVRITPFLGKIGVIRTGRSFHVPFSSYLLLSDKQD